MDLLCLWDSFFFIGPVNHILHCIAWYALMFVPRVCIPLFLRTWIRSLIMMTSTLPPLQRGIFWEFFRTCWRTIRKFSVDCFREWGFYSECNHIFIHLNHIIYSTLNLSFSSKFACGCCTKFFPRGWIEMSNKSEMACGRYKVRSQFWLHWLQFVRAKLALQRTIFVRARLSLVV